MKSVLREGRESILKVLSESSLNIVNSSQKPRIERAYDVVDWMKDNGAEFPYEFEFRQYGDGDGVGIFALEDIPSEEFYCKVPEQLSIQMQTFDDSELGEMLKEEKLSNELKLMMFTLYSKFYSEDSFYEPFFDSLPSSYLHIPIIESLAHKFFNTGVEFENYFLPFLASANSSMTPREQENSGIVSYLRRFYTGTSLLFMETTSLIAKYPELSEIFGYQAGDPISNDFKLAFLWGQGLLFSHSYVMNEEPNLFPFFDFANASSKCEEHANYDHWRVRYADENDECFLAASSPFEINKNEEILACYNHPNYELLAMFGFVLKDHFNDSVYINDDMQVSLRRFKGSLEEREDDLSHSEKKYIESVGDIFRFVRDNFSGRDDYQRQVLEDMTKSDMESNGMFAGGILMNDYMEFQYNKLTEYIDFINEVIQ